MWDRAVRIVRAIEDIDDRHVALDHLVRALAKAQQWDRAERLALDIDNTGDQERALVVLADALAEARLWDRAQRVVGRIDTSAWRAIAMAAVAKRLAHSDYERAVHLVTEARIVAHVGGGGASLQVLIAHAVVLAKRDPENADQLWTEAEQVARSITVPEERARMLAVLATSCSSTSADRAMRLGVAARQVLMASEDGEWEMTKWRLFELFVEAELWEQAELAARDMRHAPIRAKRLAELAEIMVGVDRTRAEQIAADAEEIARSATKIEWPDSVCDQLLDALIAVRSWRYAEQLVTVIDSTYGRPRRLRRLVVALAANEQWDRAERIAGAEDYAEWQDWTLADLAMSLASTDQWQHAEQVASTISQGYQRGRTQVALLDRLANAHRWDDAERIVRSVDDSDLQRRSAIRLVSYIAEFDPPHAERVLVDLAQVVTGLRPFDPTLHTNPLSAALAVGGQWETAENIVNTLEDYDVKREAVFSLSHAYASSQRWEDAKRLALTLEDARDRAFALTKIIPLIARTRSLYAAELVPPIEDEIRAIDEDRDRDEALAELSEALLDARLVAPAVRIARIIAWPTTQALTLAGAAKAINDVDSLQCERLADEAEQKIRGIADPGQKAYGAASLTEALANAGLWRRAEQLANGIDHRDEQARALQGVSRALAAASLWNEAEQVASKIDNAEQQASALQVIIKQLMKNTGTGTQPDVRSRLHRLLALSLSSADPFGSMADAADMLHEEIVDLCDVITSAMLNSMTSR